METPSLKLTPAEEALRDAALEYHRSPGRGKISIAPTKPLANQRDLSLAYSPGVAYVCLAIQKDPSLAAELTSRQNLVGVVTNGTAILGLGNLGATPSQDVEHGMCGTIAILIAPIERGWPCLQVQLECLAHYLGFEFGQQQLDGIIGHSRDARSAQGASTSEPAGACCGSSNSPLEPNLCVPNIEAPCNLPLIE